jgi:hypothetical protein
MAVTAARQVEAASLVALRAITSASLVLAPTTKARIRSLASRVTGEAVKVEIKVEALRPPVAAAVKVAIKATMAGVAVVAATASPAALRAETNREEALPFLNTPGWRTSLSGVRRTRHQGSELP